jgi:hypothetical protein
MNIPDQYFLTAAKKRSEQRKLKAAIKRGEVDKEIIPYLTRLNAIPGLMSQFCCTGHKKREGNLVVLVSAEWFERLLINPNLNLHAELWNKAIVQAKDGWTSDITTVSWDFFTGICRVCLRWPPKATKHAMNCLLEYLESCNG